jgi:hypothetical protein
MGFSWEIRKNRPPPDDAGPALPRAGIWLPRGAHAAPSCPEAQSRRLHPGVLPPLPALALFLEARAGAALTQDLEGRPILGELLRDDRWILFSDTALGRDLGVTVL